MNRLKMGGCILHPPNNKKGNLYMLHRLANYRNPNESRLNKSIINRECEKNLVLYVVDVYKSISDVLTEVTMDSWDFVVDIEKVDRSSYERSRKTGKTKPGERKKPPKKAAYIAGSWLGELTMKFTVDMSEYLYLMPEEAINNPKHKDHIPEKLHFTVKLLIPIQDSKGNYMLRGIRYVNQYQLTEASTYVTANTLVEKSLMPIKTKKVKVNATDAEGNALTFNAFKVQMFTGFVNILYFFLSEYSWFDTLELFSIGEYVEVVDCIDTGMRPDSTYIKMGQSYLRVLTSALQSDYIQSMVGTILDAVGNKTTFEEIDKEETWIRKIGSTKKGSLKESFYGLGIKHKKLFNRMLDKATQEVLRLEEYNRCDILSLIRWMVQNYEELRNKDNLNILFKRLRGNELVASLLNGVVSDDIKTLVNTTCNTPQKAIAKYKRFFQYKGNELISQCHRSGLIKWDEGVNDLTLFEKLRVTMKGPNAVGNKNQRNVSARIRALHPSHIGRIGISISSPSDPGLTNYLNPLVEMDGLFFKNSPPEPERFFERYMEELNIPNDEETSSAVIVDPVKFQGVLYNLQHNFEISYVGKEKEEVDE